MNASPSPSPRRQPNQRYGNDQDDFYQINLSNDVDAEAPIQQQKRRPQSSFLAGGRYDSYDSSYNSYDSYGDSVGPDGTGSLRPVQQYHNAFSSTDTAAKTDAAPSAAASPFATFSSASRAFLEHRRQQSIPNMLPSFASSITRSFSRAISPERTTRPARPPIPDYSAYNSQSNDKDTTDDDSESSDSEVSDSEDSEDSDDSADSNGNQDSRRFTGDRRPRQNTYTTKTSGTSGNPESPALKNNFASWLANSNTKRPQSRVGSPTRRLFAPSPTTPERTLFTTRGGESPKSETARRRLSYASDGLATPRSAGLAPSSTAASRFSQLTTSMTATLSRLTQQQQPRAGHRGRPYDYENDEFYHLDVEACLFPSGQPEDHDAFSPSAYKNLEANAARTISRLQEAYQQRTTALWDLAAEKSARDEEFEEAETRVQHLKMQLEGMAHKAAEQQKEMEALKEELAAEKTSRAHERAMLLSSAGVGGYQDLRDDDQMTTTAFSEDLGVEEAQRTAMQKKRRDPRRRKSSDDSDDGDEEEEGDEDESASSVFSRSRSPTMAAGGPGGPGGLDAHTAYHPRVAALGSVSATKQGSSRPTSPSAATLGKFQKIVKNVAAALKDEDGLGEYGQGGCRNCRGQDASFAWNTVGVLRDENKQLKLRVGQLEVAVEGALDMVNGVGLY